MYKIKEIYFTIQGEGFHTGRPSVFVRFSGCNLWSGVEKDRNTAICNWCDTDFVGTDGANGGKYSVNEIAKILLKLWPSNNPSAAACMELARRAGMQILMQRPLVVA